MKKNMEIELKMLISDDNLKRLLELELVQAALVPNSKEVQHLRTSYYDTDTMKLQSQGIAYRVRDKGDGTFEATVKMSKKKSSGLSERVELNIPLQENKAILTGFKELGLDFDLADIVPEGVNCLFTVDVKRTIYLAKVDETVIELAIDKGNVIAGDKAAPVDELEMEIKAGDTATLLNFALEIAKKVPMLMESRSKYARGLTLCKLPGCIPEDAKTTEPAEEALKRLAVVYSEK